MAEHKKKEEAEWERVQVKTFTKWVNSHLGKRGHKLESLKTDLADGINLIILLEVISGESVGKYDAKPKMKINKVENVNKALKFIAAHDVKLVGIGAEEIVDENMKMILGMIWTIILRFAISGLSEEGLSAKEGLLLWCRRKTEPYKNVDVKDFSGSFQDGLAFCALIHRHRPDLIDYDKLHSDDKLGNLNLAFDVALKHLDVPRLLDAEDIVNMPRPDERSIMTYVAQLYKVFSSLDQAETAGRRVAKYAGLAQQAADMLHDYEARTRVLVDGVVGKTQELQSSPVGDDYHTLKHNIGSLADFKKTKRREMITEQADLATLFGNIQAKLKAMNRPAYVPPHGLAVPDVETLMESLASALKDRRSVLNSTLRQVLDRLRQDFATPANSFFDHLKALKEALALPPAGELEAQLHFYQTKSQELHALEGQLPSILALENKCVEANIEDNEFSDHTHDDLQFEYEQLVKNYRKKVSFIEGQILAVKQSQNVSAEQLAEFKEAFHSFDSNKDGLLSRLEFKSLLAALGLIEVDFEGQSKKFDEIFKKVSAGSEQISPDQFLPYMISITVDSVSPSQLADSFATISGGKDHVTINDLRIAQIPQSQIDYLLSVMPPKQGIHEGYDYKAYLGL
eukprot:TRINITY_DN4_c0_g1_i1.p1 TRINITY_DN4_c0_g1~~TRINITY_DN4_c0_g1_i1.p1  ORF type:complete len:627 (-),score=273.46 TRINITY_DN4_c0_g1_i1:116-1996(-)